MSTAVVTGATHVFSYNDPNARVSDEILGTGSVYTYRAYGTAGQTVEVRGGFAGDDWADMQHIATLTVDAADPIVAPRSTTRIHAWPVLAVSGTAQLKIARSA